MTLSLILDSFLWYLEQLEVICFVLLPEYTFQEDRLVTLSMVPPQCLEYRILESGTVPGPWYS